MAGQVRQTQLFNLAENPYELIDQHHAPGVIALTQNTPEECQRNLASDPPHREKLQEMEALLLAEMRRLDDPYRLWNQPSDERMLDILKDSDEEPHQVLEEPATIP